MGNVLGRVCFTAAFVGLAAVPAGAQVTETVLYAFDGSSTGIYPEAGLLADIPGPSGALHALYGTTSSGPFSGGCFENGGCGTVFSLTRPGTGQTSWTGKTLWGFSGGSDGAYPEAGLFAATAQISQSTPLYGTTFGGAGGFGTVFSLVGKTLTTLWTFTGGADGGDPCRGQVVSDSRGALYACAFSGGSKGHGTVIKLTSTGKPHKPWMETTIWTFSGGADGGSPTSLIMGADGVLYGTTASGGGSGNGTVFKLVPPGNGQTAWTEQALWSFKGGTDGSDPETSLTEGREGTLFGTTYYGGGSQNCAMGCGTVFKLFPPETGKGAWSEHVLWRFTGPSDGAGPAAAVILDRAGAVFGTASSGGGSTGGTVFRLTPPASGQGTWREKTLYTFNGAPGDGAEPFAPLTASKSGVLYGTTLVGGPGGCTAGCGVVFSLSGTGFVP